MWYESDKATQDKNNNNYMEPDATANGNGNGQNGGEQWFYEPSRDRATTTRPFDPTVTSPPKPQTGYGSNFRGVPGDVGLPILFKPQTGQQPAAGKLVLHARR